MKIEKKILYINNHTIERIEERGTIDLKNIEKYNIKIMNILESKILDNKFLNNKFFKNKKIHIVKKALLLNNKYIMPLRVFKENNIIYYKVLSAMYDNQFFTSVNLNFGIYNDLKDFQFDDLELKDKYFSNENDIVKQDINLNWQNNFIDETEFDREIIFDREINNYIFNQIKFPLYVKTFRNRVFKLSIKS